MNIEEMAEQIRREMKAENDEVRKTVIKLLQINNQGETIIGACNSRMAEVLLLREEVKRLKAKR